MEILENQSLKKYNTFGVDASAKFFARFGSAEELRDFIVSDSYRHDPKLILNGGSNVLFTRDFDGVVMKVEINGINVTEEDNDHVLVKAGAGVSWNDFVDHCIEQGWGGLENLTMIPGNVGAAPVQNIGAYGVEQKDCFCSLEAMDMNTGEIKTFGKHACRFGYRQSIFKQEFKGRYVVLSVTYKLSKYPEFNLKYGSIEHELNAMDISEVDLKSVRDAIRRIRAAKLPDPEFVGNAGSFFKNPVITKSRFYKISDSFPHVSAFPVDKTHYKLSAGWLIESLGWKGRQRGDAGVWHTQALVLVNYGNATGKQIYELAGDISDSVYDAYQIRLEPEVHIV